MLPGWLHNPLRMAWPLWGWIPWTWTWSQVVAQPQGICRPLSGNKNLGDQHRPPLLHQGYRSRHGPWHQPGPQHHHGPVLQTGHPHQPVPHCHGLWRSSFLPSTWTSLLFLSPSHFTTIYSLTIIVPNCPTPMACSWSLPTRAVTDLHVLLEKKCLYYVTITNILKH